MCFQNDPGTSNKRPQSMFQRIVFVARNRFCVSGHPLRSFRPPAQPEKSASAFGQGNVKKFVALVPWNGRRKCLVLTIPSVRHGVFPARRGKASKPCGNFWRFWVTGESALTTLLWHFAPQKGSEGTLPGPSAKKRQHCSGVLGPLPAPPQKKHV
jgi:hypothetical protein